MADLIEFGDGSPVAPKTGAPSTAQADNVFVDFDPLGGGGNPGAPAPAAAADRQGLGMPKAVAEAFAAASGGAGGGMSSEPTKEYLPSGLSVQGQEELMRQIEESAKKMAKDGDATDAVKKVESSDFIGKAEG